MKTISLYAMQNSISSTRGISLLCRDWLTGSRPPAFRLPLHGLAKHPGASICDEQSRWEPNANYTIPNTTILDARKLAVAFVSEFVATGGHVVWVGTTEDLYRMSEQLMFHTAGVAIPDEDADVQLDIITYINLTDARTKMMDMWIDFCNVEDCGDSALEQEFITSMSSFKPTLIVVDASIFVDGTLDPFESLIRETCGLMMVDRLRASNPVSSVLWLVGGPSC